MKKLIFIIAKLCHVKIFYIYRVEISSHFFFSWDCIRKVDGLKFHVVCSELIQNNYWLLWIRWKSNCFLCCFVFQHNLNVFCGEKKQRETLLIFLFSLCVLLQLWKGLKKRLSINRSLLSVKKYSTSKSYFFSVVRLEEKNFWKIICPTQILV